MIRSNKEKYILFSHVRVVLVHLFFADTEHQCIMMPCVCRSKRSWVVAERLALCRCRLVWR